MKRTGFLKKKRPINLRRKAWDVFSKWIRERDKICVTCGSRNTVLNAGHFWHGVLDFDEININAQCTGCNNYKSGNLAPYSIYLINKYGIEEFQKLEARHWLAMRGEIYTDTQLRAIIEKYKLE